MPETGKTVSGTPRRLIDDCFLHDKDRLRHQEAVNILKSRLAPVAGSSVRVLEACAGRILAEEIVSPRDIPLHDNAAVDGYAFRAADFSHVDGRFEIAARIIAGDLQPAPLSAKKAVRIFTGAVVPVGADTVVMQEDCTVEKDGDGKDIVIIPAGLKVGANRRMAGEDIKADSVMLTAGQRLRPQDIAAIASTGKADVKVYDNLRIALISTGNELRRPGTEIELGQTYDSNHYLLAALLQTGGASITDYGVIADEEKATRDVLSEAARNNDVILTTGGASRGEEDYIISVLDTIGRRHMWQMAIKPGRPMVFGQISGADHQCLFFGLPGNPVAAMVCYLMYVYPSLNLLAGGVWREPARYPLPAAFEISSKKPDRREFLRGQLLTDSNGRLSVSKYQRDGSGLISSLREADGLIEIGEDVTRVETGEAVNFIPFSEFGIVK